MPIQRWDPATKQSTRLGNWPTRRVAVGAPQRTPQGTTREIFDPTLWPLRATWVALGDGTVAVVHPQPYHLEIIKPDGTSLISTSVTLNATRLIDTLALPMPGTYTILVDPSTANTGGITVQLNDATDAAGYSIAPGGPAVTVTVICPPRGVKRTALDTRLSRICSTRARSARAITGPSHPTHSARSDCCTRSGDTAVITSCTTRSTCTSSNSTWRTDPGG
jgi:hypothetical protein